MQPAPYREPEAQQAPAPVPALTSTRPIKLPNISFLRTRTAIVAGSSLENVLSEKRNSKGGASDVTALVACFRNEPSGDRRVSDELSVTANLVFRDAEGQELGEGIARACWLEHGGSSVDLDVGHSRCAVLMVVAGAHNPIFVPYKTRVRVNHRLSFITETFKFEHPPATIELRLLSSRNDPLLPAMVFHFSLMDGIPNAVVRDQNSRSEAKTKNASTVSQQNVVYGPQVVLSCEWPAQTSRGEISGVHVVLNRPFVLKNLSDVAATNVQIESILRATGTIEFRAVSLLEKGKDVRLTPVVKTARGHGVRDFENILQDEEPNLLSGPAPEAYTIRLPMTVTYNDLHGNKFESLHELTYDLYDRSGDIAPKGIRQV